MSLQSFNTWTLEVWIGESENWFVFGLSHGSLGAYSEGRSCIAF